MKEEAKEERKRIKNIQKQCAREGKRKKRKVWREKENSLAIVKLWVSHFSKYLQKCHWTMLFEN